MQPDEPADQTPDESPGDVWAKATDPTEPNDTEPNEPVDPRDEGAGGTSPTWEEIGEGLRKGLGQALGGFGSRAEGWTEEPSTSGREPDCGPHAGAHRHPHQAPGWRDTFGGATGFGAGFGPGFGRGFGPKPVGGRHGHAGPPPWLADLVRSFGGPDLGATKGPKVRRGDVRIAILDVLSREEMNGYQIIQQIAERSGGGWKPSPGSVYPTVQQLEDEGLVEGVDGDGRRLLRLTEEGRRYVDQHPDEVNATWRPFEAEPAPEPPPGTGDLKPLVGQVMGAVWQIMVSGSAGQKAEAAEVLGETRRRLYGLLAEGDPE
jgi:DNA-binding PadR family transcriptional regulator